MIYTNSFQAHKTLNRHCGQFGTCAHYFECHYLILSQLAVLAITISMLLRSGIFKSGLAGLYKLIELQFYNQAFFLCIAYAYFRKVHERHLSELLTSIHSGKPKHLLQSLSCFSLTTMIYQSIVFSLIYIIVRVNGEQPYFLIWLWKPFLINIILPTLISIMLAFTLANRVQTLHAYGLMIFYLLMISPISESLQAYELTELYYLRKIISIIKAPFSILYQNAQWDIDLQSGLQTERPRLILQLFWLIFLYGLSPVINIMIFRKFGREVIRITLLSISFVLIFIALQPASLYRLNMSSEGYWADKSYYTSNFSQQDLTLKSVVDPGFEISAYDLDINLNFGLDVLAKIIIETDYPRSEFVLTLYHGYKIKWLHDSSGNQIQYQRRHDSIILNLAEPIQSAQIEISYSGFSNVMYSNSEAAMLPGFFPWYPMAGEHQVYINEPDFGSGYNPYNRIAKAHFILRVTGSQNIVTNLEIDEEGYFQGQTDAISLFAGHISKTNDPLIKTYLPLEIRADFSENQLLEFYKKTFSDVIFELKNQRPAYWEDLNGKPVYLVSGDLCRNFTFGNFAVFSDYILISNTKITPDILKLYDDANKNYRADSILCRIYRANQASTAAETLLNMIQQLESLKSEYQNINSDQIPLEIAETIALLNPILQADEKLGSEAVIAAIEKYCQSNYSPTNDLIMLSILIEG